MLAAFSTLINPYNELQSTKKIITHPNVPLKVFTKKQEFNPIQKKNSRFMPDDNSRGNKG
jgi:hypothetical protein